MKKKLNRNLDELKRRMIKENGRRREKGMRIEGIQEKGNETTKITQRTFGVMPLDNNEVRHIYDGPTYTPSTYSSENFRKLIDCKIRYKIGARFQRDFNKPEINELPFDETHMEIFNRNRNRILLEILLIVYHHNRLFQ